MNCNAESWFDGEIVSKQNSGRKNLNLPLPLILALFHFTCFLLLIEIGTTTVPSFVMLLSFHFSQFSLFFLRVLSSSSLKSGKSSTLMISGGPDSVMTSPDLEDLRHCSQFVCASGSIKEREWYLIGTPLASFFRC